MTSKLGPCPWCQEQPRYSPRVRSLGEAVECENEKCPVRPSSHSMKEGGAITAWNTRVENVTPSSGCVWSDLGRPCQTKDCKVCDLARENIALREAMGRMRGVLSKSLAFVEEIERREDTHYLLGGEISEALASIGQGKG